MPLSKGDRVDRFIVEALLGRGGMGVVYCATDPRLGRRVAIKLLEGLTADSPARARFDREARLIASLDHPAAVHVYEAGESDGTPYIVMELVDGVTLRVAAANETSWRVKLGWLVEAASALAAAHDAGLVHRDVKPDNVMVRTDGRVKVLDFGIARRVRVASTGATTEGVTAEGTIVGTPRYMAPEQLRGEPLDGRADQFAWGVTAFEVLSGESPWGDTEDGVSLISRILGSPAPPVIPKVPGLPAAAGDVLMRTLAKERHARFGTMREVVESLWDVLGGRPAPVSGGVGAVASAPTEEAPLVVTPPRFTPEALAPTEALSGPPAAGPAAPPVPRRSLVLPLAIGLVVVAGAGAAWAVKRSHATAVPVTTTASASATASTPPVSANPEAARLYALGEETWRTDSDLAGLGAWQRAVQLDPDLCQAQLRIAAYGLWYPDVNVATAYEAARRCEGSLDARDRALLEALAPLNARPVDVAAVAAATLRAVEAFPDDLPVLYLRGLFLTGSDPAAALPVFDHIIQLDPRFAHAYTGKANALQGLGRQTEAEAILLACNTSNPTSTLCTTLAFDALDASGKCGEAESMARHFVALRPSSPAGYNCLARALAARAAPPEAIEAAMEESLAKTTPGTTSYTRGRTETLARLRASYGNFPGVLDLLDERDRDDAKLNDLVARAQTVRRRIDVLRETGQVDAARSLARSFLRRSEAYSKSGERDLSDLLGQAVLLGVAPMSALVDVLSRDPGSARLSPAERWVDAYVWDNPTVPFARQAVAAMPAPEALQTMHDKFVQRRGAVSLRGVGVTLARGGRPDLAVSWLRDGLVSCMDAFEAFSWRHAELELGKALEAQGDRAGARERYQSVLRYWGDAKPRSVTADEARTRLAALGP